MADKKTKKPTTKSIPPAASGESKSARQGSSDIQVSAAQAEHGFRRKIIGTVVSDKMQKTVVVEVINRAMHPMYKKYVRTRTKYKAHDENNQYRVGDKVEIMEHRPLSAHKRWTVARLVNRPVEA